MQGKRFIAAGAEHTHLEKKTPHSGKTEVFFACTEQNQLLVDIGTLSLKASSLIYSGTLE